MYALKTTQNKHDKCANYKTVNLNRNTLQINSLENFAGNY